MTLRRSRARPRAKYGTFEVRESLLAGPSGEFAKLEIHVADFQRRHTTTDNGHPLRKVSSVGYREFDVPSDGEFTDVLGVRPTPGDETGVRVLRVEDGDGGTLEVVFDALRRSVTARLSDRGCQKAEVYREGAVSVRLSRQAPQLSINFETDDTKGSLRVSMPPSAEIVEAVLLA